MNSKLRRAESFEACCQWALLNVPIFSLILYTNTLMLSFCDYMSESLYIWKVLVNAWRQETLITRSLSNTQKLIFEDAVILQQFQLFGTHYLTLLNLLLP